VLRAWPSTLSSAQNERRRGYGTRQGPAYANSFVLSGRCRLRPRASPTGLPTATRQARTIFRAHLSFVDESVLKRPTRNDRRWRWNFREAAEPPVGAPLAHPPATRLLQVVDWRQFGALWCTRAGGNSATACLTSGRIRLPGPGIRPSPTSLSLRNRIADSLCISTDAVVPGDDRHQRRRLASGLPLGNASSFAHTACPDTNGTSMCVSGPFRENRVDSR
jgi:hypothetical protein